jgi:hypothetical protein
MTNGDDAGRRCAGNVFVAVGAERLVRYVKLGEGEQPTDWSPEDILGSFGSVKRKKAANRMNPLVRHFARDAPPKFTTRRQEIILFCRTYLSAVSAYCAKWPRKPSFFAPNSH